MIRQILPELLQYSNTTFLITHYKQKIIIKKPGPLWSKTDKCKKKKSEKYIVLIIKICPILAQKDNMSLLSNGHIHLETFFSLVDEV